LAIKKGSRNARKLLSPLFRFIFCVMEFGDRFISLAIAQMVFFCTSPLLMFSRLLIASLLWLPFNMRMILAPQPLNQIVETT